jgi:hypothetical protein
MSREHDVRPERAVQVVAALANISRRAVDDPEAGAEVSTTIPWGGGWLRLVVEWSQDRPPLTEETDGG